MPQCSLADKIWRFVRLNVNDFRSALCKQVSAWLVEATVIGWIQTKDIYIYIYNCSAVFTHIIYEAIEMAIYYAIYRSLSHVLCY